MVTKGRLIVFEGVDATGKTSLCNDLYGILRKQVKPVRQFQFPGKTPGTLGELVYRIHHHHQDEFSIPTLNPCSKQLLHIAAHIDIIKSAIKPLLREGIWIVLDRFWWSTYVYGHERGISEQALEYMIQLEKEAWGTVLPSSLFLIDSSKPLRDSETDSISWQRKRMVYKELLKSEALQYPCSLVQTERGNDARSSAMEKILDKLLS